MKFQAESDLVEALKEYLIATYRRSHIKIFQEVSLGYGIADIVVSELKSQSSKDICLDNLLNISDINIYTVVKSTPEVSLEGLIDITRCSKVSIVQSVKKLLSREYLIEIDDTYQVIDHYNLNFVSNFAVEAKLKDWRRALKQAYRYKWFAEYSFVVLDAYYSKPALKNLNLFEKYNVGLASVSVDGKLQRHFNPKREVPIDLKMQMLFSEKVKSYELAK
ncbi:hypothetical protein [Arcticibacter eurypsychrophilus]|uniref:hypothetical protein n=1 Tax=Arcticibacter eurypsychrophilus TaxID=1434752 RepID=UPI00084D3F47|nr:hypothetical protein [Arcticibacter eurypsychrophilus]